MTVIIDGEVVAIPSVLLYAPLAQPYALMHRNTFFKFEACLFQNVKLSTDTRV